MNPTTLQGVLMVGPARARWPEPLGVRVDREDLAVQSVANLHEAAARLASRSVVRILALLLEPALLTPSHLPLLPLLARRAHLPLILLPVIGELNPSARNACRAGVLFWEDAIDILETLGRSPSAPLLQESAPPWAGASQSDTPAASPTSANATPSRLDFEAENAVTLPVEARYDEVSGQPLLTDDEMRALLGAQE